MRPKYQFIILCCVIGFASIFMWISYFRNQFGNSIPEMFVPSPTPADSEISEEEKLINRIESILDSWKDIKTVEYLESGNNGSSFYQSLIRIDRVNESAVRDNLQVGGNVENVYYPRRVDKDKTKLRYTMPDNSVLDNPTDMEYANIYELNEISKIFIDQLSVIMDKQISYEVLEEEIDGSNRIKIKIYQSEKTTSVNIVPVELMLEYTQEGRVGKLGVPIVDSYTLFSFTAYDFSIN